MFNLILKGQGLISESDQSHFVLFCLGISREQSLLITRNRRPDMLEKANLTKEDIEFLIKSK